MRVPPLVVALSVSAALGAGAAVASAQDVPPFQPEPTTPTPTTTTPAPAPDSTAPAVAVRLPATRVGRRITRIRIAMRDLESGVRYSQVDVRRRIRLAQGVRDQAWDGRRWRTTASATRYRLYPTATGRSISYVLRFRKGLPRARYWITVRAQNEPGDTATERVSFRTR